MEFLFDDIIDAKSINLNEWLNYLFSDKISKVFPNNCFPTDNMLNEYLDTIDSRSDLEVKSLIRRFLIHNSNFESDKLSITYLAQSNSKEKLIELINSNEHVRKLFSRQDTWEGITWILDLLPHWPNESLRGLNAYFLAQCQYLPDYSINGLSDAGVLIRAKYINYEHTQEVFLSLTPINFELLVEKLYQARGYETTTTKKSHDGGVDIVAFKKIANNQEKIIIQCKRYTKKITVREVRELSGTLYDYSLKSGIKPTKAVLVTSSDFTRSVKKEFENNHTIELINSKELGILLNTFVGRYWVERIDKILNGNTIHIE